MKVIGRVVLVAVVVGGFVALAYAIVNRSDPIVQPVAFNHVVHLEDASLTCLECHLNAETGVYAGLPGKESCLDCHDVDDEGGTHPEKDKLFAYEEKDEDIPWLRVRVTAPDVFFSHRRHVAVAQTDCLECHRDQATLTAPPHKAELVMTMTACISCHEESGVSTDCLACHR